MIRSTLISRLTKYKSAGEELGCYLDMIQDEYGYKVISVTEAEDRFHQQGFLVLYDDSTDAEQKEVEE